MKNLRQNLATKRASRVERKQARQLTKQMSDKKISGESVIKAAVISGLVETVTHWALDHYWSPLIQAVAAGAKVVYRAVTHM